jgi:isopentenyl diphosphate isomerase/L-lactate dehydrogenase-like FMN-dependent dehydrogenase
MTQLPPVDELVNAEEFREMARRKLDTLTFAEIDGSDRSYFDRITFRPRLMVDSRQMDLSTTLFGQTLFTPIIIGPIANLKRYHPEGEQAMARGAAAAKAAWVMPRSSPVEEFQWHEIEGGEKPVFLTIGPAGIDWKALDRIRKTTANPLVLKGVMSAEEARRALTAGVQGIVVSNYSPRPIAGTISAIEMLSAIAEAVAGKAAVLIDGSIRRGSDVLKALALGANAVLIARPAVWGLAAYGAEGVRAVIELIQSEFARDMAMCGKLNFNSLDPTVVRILNR